MATFSLNDADTSTTVTVSLTYNLISANTWTMSGGSIFGPSATSGTWTLMMGRLKFNDPGSTNVAYCDGVPSVPSTFSSPFAGLPGGQYAGDGLNLTSSGTSNGAMGWSLDGGD
jgi:hypothetical protein